MLKTRPQLRRLRPPVEGLFCNYSNRTCMQNRLDGFDFCLKHILEDKISPFKQCSYISAKTNRKCGNAAPKTDRKEGYCLEHSRRANFLLQKIGRKKRPRETPETLLEELDQSYPPMKDGKVELKKTRIGESLASKILDYGSSSDSDSEMPLVDQAWHGDGESDAESIDSEQEDPLKHAGIYTAEEVTLIMRDKLIRLQSLYIEQFKRLQHIMKEKRRKYLHTVKQEKETSGNAAPNKADPANREKFTKLAALKRYHQRHGKEALLHKQSKERRVAVSEGPGYRAPVYPKCSHLTAGVRCNAMTLPLSKLCIQHVLHDSHQVLFRPCSFALDQCGRPVPVYKESMVCGLHLPLTDFNIRVTKEEETQELVEVEVKAPIEEDVKMSLDILEPILPQASSEVPAPETDLHAPESDTTTPMASSSILSNVSDGSSTTAPSTLSMSSSAGLVTSLMSSLAPQPPPAPSPQPEETSQPCVPTPQQETQPSPTINFVPQIAAEEFPKPPQDTRQILLQHLQGQAPNMVPPRMGDSPTVQDGGHDISEQGGAQEEPIAMETEQSPCVDQEG